uniref:Uncharacterized protein n=1 Tax=Nelumbo nucifera TaxID=4432 RepID=A0A822YLX6_NELNU|nr:TPA_asm: hypothetical protein HUJ06_010757 [Nelumbo nucifera]
MNTQQMKALQWRSPLLFLALLSGGQNGESDIALRGIEGRRSDFNYVFSFSSCL